MGKVDSMNPSTSTLSNHDIDFPSREQSFREALKALQPDQKSHMIALCGMGGVGKTTMMEKLKMVVIEKKMFSMIIRVFVGQRVSPYVIQDVVAEYLGIILTETAIETRAYKLRKSFEALSDGGKNKILVLLDDVWELFDLNDIGLSPLPNQGVEFKVLLTSQNRNVCIMMGVEVNSILNLDVIEDLEAQSFFHQLVEISDVAESDPDLCKIGDEIVSRCHGLPLAIKVIAYALKSQRNKYVWEDTLSRLKNHDFDQVLHQVFEISYNNLQNEETKSVFLLCGLFHQDFDIPREDLVRYGWGLKLFDNVHTIRKARNRLNKCIDELIQENLLIESWDVGCVKMHNVVRDFVLDMYSKVEHTTIDRNMSTWSSKYMSPQQNHMYPKLLLLKRMHGDKWRAKTQLLEVTTYHFIKCPSVPRSLQCSTNLRVLCLHRCSLMFDCSSIGEILNLEVLSFAYCSIQNLPSAIGNLKELKLLDLTGCVDLCIDDGVLKSLVKLEELYMRAADVEGCIRFRDSNRNELAECLKNLLVLEVEFFGNNSQPKNMSFKNLEIFKISLGCYLRENNGQNRHSYENTLMLVTNKCELLDSRMYELFEKTEVLNLQVDGINYLGDDLADGINDLGNILVESLHHHPPSFYNLRVLEVCECSDLRYLFTIDVANGLTKLERLKVSFCPVLETLVDGDSGGVGVIKFQSLKLLSLGELPKLMSLCSVNVIELPELEELILYSLPNFTSIYPGNKASTSSMWNGFSVMRPFLNKEVVLPQLKILKIFYMKKLKVIWPSEISNREEVGLSKLRVISVQGCDGLVNLFPINPMSLLHHLEELQIWNCGSVDVLFNIDVGCVDDFVKGSNNLRHIEVNGLGKLRYIWRVTGVSDSNPFVSGFQVVEHIEIRRCKSFQSVITFEMRAHMKVTIDGIKDRR